MNKSDICTGMELVVTSAHYTNPKGFENGDIVVCMHHVYGSLFKCRNKYNSDVWRMSATELSPATIASAAETMNNTPATRKGIQVGDHVVDIRTGARYTLVLDTGGNYPLFKNEFNSTETKLFIGDVQKVGEALKLKTPAEEANIKVGDYVRGKSTGDYYQVTDLGNGNRLEMNNISWGEEGVKNIVKYLIKVTEEEAKAATTPLALKGLKVGDIVVTYGSIVMADGNCGILESGADARGIVAAEEEDTVTVRTTTGEVRYPAIRYLRKASKNRVIEYLRNATGKVEAEIVKFALA
jgi:hypothetical protein